MERNVQKQKKLNEAITYIKRIIKKNLYSESLLRKKLSDRGFEEVADDVLDLLKDLGLINDEKFAKHLAVNIAEFKKYGPNRVKKILISKGYDEFLSEKIVSELDIDFFELACENARNFLRKRTFKNEFEKRRKLYSYLFYRGFDNETIEETLKEIKEEDK
jgi:regulatory protein